MTTLYVFRDMAGKVLYVGISKAAIQRWAQHESEKSWWADVATTETTHYPTRQAALEAERTLIQALRPPYNGTSNPRSGRTIERVEPTVYQHYSDGPNVKDPGFGTMVARFHGMCGGLGWPRCPACAAALDESGQCFAECGGEVTCA